MKTIAIRLALLLLFLAVLVFVPIPIQGPFSAALSGSVWATVFAVAVIYLTGRAPVFIVLTVFVATVVLPLVVLCWITLPFAHSWQDAAGTVFSSIFNNGPLWGFEILIPLVLVAAGVAFLPRVIRASPTKA